MMVNDEPRTPKGTLAVALESTAGEKVARKAVPFALAALGQDTFLIDLAIPQTTGNSLLKAVAETADKTAGSPVLSRRKVTIVEAGKGAARSR